VFEPGCSVGELTVLLAARCGQVIATDVADAAVARARERCAPCPNATVTRATLPDEFPEGDFDLIVFSEIGYYFDEPVLQAVATNLESHLRGGGRIIAAHWIGHSPDHVLSGDEVHAVLHEQLELRHVAHERHASSERDGFVLDVWDTV
jgi:SAM-dependent methyltransferase